MSEDMNAPPNGWPVGTVCVVTHDPINDPNCFEGHMLSVLSPAQPLPEWGGLCNKWGVPAGTMVQGVSTICPVEGRTNNGVWPTAWMRPLEDPDAETIETEDEVTA